MMKRKRNWNDTVKFILSRKQQQTYCVAETHTMDLLDMLETFMYRPPDEGGL